MVIIKIGSGERQFSSVRDIDESWINQQINRRNEDGLDVCVQVSVQQEAVDIRLSTPACTGYGGGGRRATEQEQGIFDLWEKHGLNASDFTGGKVVAFFKQLRKLLN